jgi:hypothetical protein
MNLKQLFFSFLSIIALTVLSLNSSAGDKLLPFYLASQGKGDIQGTVSDIQAKLKQAQFDIVGEYTPYPNASIIIITNDELKSNATATKFGGYGAIQRVSITELNGEIQVAYTNPIYMSHAYHLKGDLAAVEAKLKSALGFVKAYGPKLGMSSDDIRGYHYMFGMPYFAEHVEIMAYPDHAQAVAALEKGLKEKKGGVSKVYRVDLPGKQQTVIGVAMTKDMSSDAKIMEEIDFKPLRSTAHLPYEVLVDADGKIYALDARFRIAINFSDLSMAGPNSFMGIMSSPDAIVAALTEAAGGELETEGF